MHLYCVEWLRTLGIAQHEFFPGPYYQPRFQLPLVEPSARPPRLERRPRRPRMRLAAAAAASGGRAAARGEVAKTW